ncbi:MAG: hypothetical protein ACXVKP_19505 [Ilumatobacteraceae bacterium]
MADHAQENGYLTRGQIGGLPNPLLVALLDHEQPVNIKPFGLKALVDVVVAMSASQQQVLGEVALGLAQV